MAPENFLSGYFLTFVLDTPEKREIIRRQLAGLLHRHLTSPPSSWPGCELQKYHYPRPDHCVIWVPPIYQCSWFCSPHKRIAASRFGNVELEAMKLSRYHGMGMPLPIKSLIISQISNRIQKKMKTVSEKSETAFV